MSCVLSAPVQVSRTPAFTRLAARVRPASEKRQGTKSREVEHWRCGGLYGDLGTGKEKAIARGRDGRDWGGRDGGRRPGEPIGADGCSAARKAAKTAWSASPA